MRKLIWTLLLFQICLSKNSATSCIVKEREALLRLKKSFYDPSNRLVSWNSNNTNGSDCCFWDGIGCDRTTGHVTKIDLRNNFQVYSSFVSYATALSTNSIDSSLFEFKYLNYLDLSWNNFNYSSIPNFFGSMLELRYLNLSHACFGGRVPPFLGNLTQLVSLDLSYDDSYYYDKPHLYIDDVEWISHLSSLQYLDLSGINLSKALNMIQILTSLPLLSSIKLSSCSLQNIHFSLDSFNSSFFTRIQLLDLSSNHFKGSIPKAFHNLTSLRFLYLSGNRFTTIEGGLQSLIGNSCFLRVFDFSYNLGGDQFFGSYEHESMGCHTYDLQVLHLAHLSVKDEIPDWLSKFTNLQFLSLSENTIHGVIPVSLGNLSRLEYLDLSDNALTGGIPTSFGRLTSLRELHLQENRLKKVEDECFVQLENLEVLDVSYNLLTGVLTETAFANLSKLHTLEFGYNEHHLLFDMKYNWIPPFQLRDLDGGSCMGCFGSEFPPWLRTQKALVYLILSNMNISSVLPTWLTGQNLIYLDLSKNQIAGSLPSSMGDQMPNLYTLYLSDNKIRGPFPTKMGGQMLNLQIFQLSNNLINDSLTSLSPFLSKFKNLEVLDLSHNQIVGPFPPNITDQLPNLEVFFINDNLINGSLPTSLCKWNRLQHFDLSNNRFSGMIQSCLLTSRLEFLDLSSNNFSGTFPGSNEKESSSVKQLCSENDSLSWMFQPPCKNDLSGVKHLYLGNNHFEGSMPILLKGSRSLEVLDLEGNNFSGNIPTWIGNSLQRLKVLRLQGNLFNGAIPSSLCNLIYLQILDLSHNQLHGSIPSNLSNFQVMREKKMSTYLEFCIEVIGYDCRDFDKIFGQSIKSNYFNYSLSRLKTVVNIDLSENYLVGVIPNEIIMLKGLIGLNLSHNNLTGTIPTKIGKMESLESLDLSFNQFVGPIPASMSELNALGVLELSHNNLSGDIPRGGHLSTFNEASSFDSNPYLCGDPLPVKCSSSESPFEPWFKVEDEDKWEKWMLYIITALGYVIGFWVVVGSLILKRSWRYAYFNFLDGAEYKLHVAMRWTKEKLKGIKTYSGNGA